MAVTPAGSLSLAQECLRDTLAQSATFQTLVGHTGNAALAEAHVYHDGLPAPADLAAYTHAELEGYRPYAILTTDPEQGYSRESDASDKFDQHGRLYIVLCRNTPEAYLAARMPTADGILEWKNIVGQIVDDLCALAGAQTAGYLIFSKIGLEYGPYASLPKDAVDEGYWQAAVLYAEY